MPVLFFLENQSFLRNMFEKQHTIVYNYNIVTNVRR